MRKPALFAVLLGAMLVVVLPMDLVAQQQTPPEGRYGPRPYPLEIATIIAVCMGESESAGSAFGVSGTVTGAYITAGDQPIVYITRGEVNPGLTPWYSQRPGDPVALIMLHTGRRTHLTAQNCYDQHFPVGVAGLAKVAVGVPDAR